MNKDPVEKKTASSENDKSSEASQLGVLMRARLFAHRKLPVMFPNPFDRELLRQSRRKDGEKNKKSEPPTDESMDLCCIWAA